MERLFRNPTLLPFAAGQSARIGAAEVTVLRLQEGLPAAIRVDLDEPAEAYTLVRWEAGKVRALTLPPPGQSVTLKREPGPVEELFGLTASN
jgi:hypothetical protein